MTVLFKLLRIKIELTTLKFPHPVGKYQGVYCVLPDSLSEMSPEDDHGDFETLLYYGRLTKPNHFLEEA